MKNLKLFVWTDWYPNYSGGLAFAIAENEIEARGMIIKDNFEINPNDWGKLTIHHLNEKVVYSRPGQG